MNEGFIDAEQNVMDHYGVTVEHRTVRSATLGEDAHVLVSGEGVDVVMVCGIGLPAAFWAPLMAELHGIRVHAIEMPGFGRTPHRDTLTDDTYRAHATAYVLEVTTELGMTSPLTLLTNSLGSLWAHWLALDRPDHVRAMIHVGCPALALGTTAPIPMRVLSTDIIGAVVASVPPSRRQVESLGRAVGQDLTIVPNLRDLLLATERLDRRNHALRHTLRAVLRNGRARPVARIGEEELARINVPTAIIWGDRDPFGSIHVAKRMHAALPQSELHLVPGGHAPWLDSAETIGHVASNFVRTHAG